MLNEHYRSPLYLIEGIIRVQKCRRGKLRPRRLGDDIRRRRKRVSSDSLWRNLRHLTSGSTECLRADRPEHSGSPPVGSEALQSGVPRKRPEKNIMDSATVVRIAGVTIWPKG